MNFKTALTKPLIRQLSFKTLLKYLRSQLSDSERKRVIRAVKLRRENKERLNGLKYFLKKYGNDTESYLTGSSIRMMAKIKKWHESNEVPKHNYKTNNFFECNNVNIKFQEAIAVGGGGVLVVISSQYSKFLFDYLNILTLTSAYLLFITGIVQKYFEEFHLWFLKIISDFEKVYFKGLYAYFQKQFAFKLPTLKYQYYISKYVGPSIRLKFLYFRR